MAQRRPGDVLPGALLRTHPRGDVLSALVVKQIQDTSTGTPIFQMDVSAGLFFSDGVRSHALAIRRAVEEFRIAAPYPPVAVLLDPEHSLIREVRLPAWSTDGWVAVLKF